MSRDKIQLVHVQWQPEGKQYHVNIASHKKHYASDEAPYYFRVMKFDTEKELIEAFPDIDITREQLFLAQLAAKGTVFKREEE